MIITYNDDYAVFERLYNLVKKYDLKSDTKGVVPNREPGVTLWTQARTASRTALGACLPCSVNV